MISICIHYDQIRNEQWEAEISFELLNFPFSPQFLVAASAPHLLNTQKIAATKYADRAQHKQRPDQVNNKDK